MPTISVITPAYNAEQTIVETIVSVQQQTFADFELIVVDDGSTDRTLELLYTVKEPRLKVFSCENYGVSVARNYGIARATGEFIAFLDADDLWTTNKLELQLAALQQHPEAGVAYSWTRIIDAQGELSHASEPVNFTGNVYAELLVRNFIYSGSNVLIRKQALESVGDFDPTLSYGEDWELYLRLAAKWSFTVVPEAQVLYRQTSNSASSKFEVMEQAILRVIEKTFLTAPLELQHLRKQSTGYFYQFLAQLCLRRVEAVYGAQLAEQHLKTALRYYPGIAFNKRTQILVIKLLLIKLLSPKLAGLILEFVSKARATSVSELNGV